MRLAGIDFGAKKAGTTAIAVLENEVVVVEQCSKKDDADRWLMEKVEQYQPSIIAIDAPLSLPKIYSDQSVEGDYFYRKCDRSLKAMSPMFLGGLTARAIKLNRLWKRKGINVIETYPGHLAQRFDKSNLRYKKDKKHIKYICDQVNLFHNWSLKTPLDSWHQTDALLALSGVYRYSKGLTESYGTADEGLIYV